MVIGPAYRQFHDLRAADCELTPVEPVRVEGVGQRNKCRVAAVPRVFRHPHFLDGGFAREGWEKDRNFNAIVGVIWPYLSGSIVDLAPQTPDKPLKPHPGMPIVRACGHLGGGSAARHLPQRRPTGRHQTRR